MKLRFALVCGAMLALTLATARVVSAAPKASGCALLTPAEIEKVLGGRFGAPSESKAPPAYGRRPWGSHCEYTSQEGPRTQVTFIVYEDASASEARQTFDKLSLWYAPKSKPAIGDEAYIDRQGAIHVLKGTVRYYLSLDPHGERQAKDLAASIAGRL